MSESVRLASAPDVVVGVVVIGVVLAAELHTGRSLAVAVGTGVAACWLGLAAAVDAETHRIPNRILALAVCSVVVAASLQPHPPAVALALGAVAAGAPLLGVRLVRHIGMGDVKMAAAIGTCGALVHPLIGLAAVTVMSVAAPVAAIALGRRALPLGPWLWFGFVASCATAGALTGSAGAWR